LAKGRGSLLPGDADNPARGWIRQEYDEGEIFPLPGRIQRDSDLSGK